MIQVNVKTGGLIPSKRLGSIEEYYFSKKINSLNSLNESDYSTLNFGIGNPDLSPANEIIEALKITASSELSHGYQSYNGIPELRDSFSKWYYDKFNVQLNPEDEVLPLLGSKEGILYVSLAYLNFGDKVLIPSLGYPTYESATIIAGGTPLNYSLLPENKWQPDWNQLESLDLTDVKIMWLNYPNMPTGARAMEETFAKAIDFGIRNNILICNDNPYSLILNDDVKSNSIHRVRSILLSTGC
jgi:aspartate/methionine/tyrosine aminotransferase